MSLLVEISDVKGIEVGRIPVVGASLSAGLDSVAAAALPGVAAKEGITLTATAGTFEPLRPTQYAPVAVAGIVVGILLGWVIFG